MTDDITRKKNQTSDGIFFLLISPSTIHLNWLGHGNKIMVVKANGRSSIEQDADSNHSLFPSVLQILANN